MTGVQTCALPIFLGEDLAFTPDAAWDVEVFATYLAEVIGAHYLGWWADSETGKVWVDGTTWYGDLAEAARVGRYRNEIAIYDIEAQAEIRL